MAFSIAFSMSLSPRTLAGATLTREEDVVELVLQQLPRLFSPAQDHGKAALQGGTDGSGDTAGAPTGRGAGVGRRC